MITKYIRNINNEKLLSAADVNKYHGISFDRQFECNPHNDTCPTRQ